MYKIRILLVTMVLLTTFIGCNKEKKYSRDLEGNWDCVLVKMQDAEGFTFFDTPAIGSNPSLGSLTIDKNQKVSCLVYSQFQTFASVVEDSLVVDGNVQLNLKANEINWITPSDTLKNRIFILTKSDLEFEYYNATLNRRIRYVFQKAN